MRDGLESVATFGGYAAVPQLTDLLARYGICCGCTTSGVEHDHKTQTLLWTASRSGLSTDRECDEMKLVSDHIETDMDKRTRSARAIWAEFYGKPRFHKKVRKDKGIKRGPTSIHTLSAWKHRLKSSFARVAKTHAGGSAEAAHKRAIKGISHVWDQKTARELEFQERKSLNAFLHSVSEGTMLATEHTMHDRQSAEVRLGHLRTLRAGRERQASKRKAQLVDAVEPSIVAGN